MRKMKNRIDLKSHSLENLSAWVVDCIESDATAEEIYATILETVQQQNIFHRACLNNTEQLLRKLPNTPPTDDIVAFQKHMTQFWEDTDITGSDC